MITQEEAFHILVTFANRRQHAIDTAADHETAMKVARRGEIEMTAAALLLAKSFHHYETERTRESRR